MQNKTRLELADYEAENLARLQKMFSRKWEFIFMQAEAQSKVDKKRDKLERKVLDSQERAFWDVHRPMVIVECISLILVSYNVYILFLFILSSLAVSTRLKLILKKLAERLLRLNAVKRVLKFYKNK